MDKVINRGRGGARKGAGRPKGDSKLFTFRCSGDMARRLDEKRNRTAFIRDSLSKALVAEPRVPDSIGSVTTATIVKPMRLPYCRDTKATTTLRNI